MTKKYWDAFKKYFKSVQFEDDLDYMILSLQMFDLDLEVTDLSKHPKAKRIALKIKILKQSFKRMNLTYGPIGAAAGGYTSGPQGAAIGAFLGSYLFAGVSVYSFYAQHFANNYEKTPTKV